MSHSYKKHVGGTYCGSSDRVWKKSWHRSFRSKIRQLLHTYDEETDIVFPTKNEVGNLWDAPSDGGAHYWPEQTFEIFLRQTMLPRYQYFPQKLVSDFQLMYNSDEKEVYKEWITRYKRK